MYQPATYAPLAAPVAYNAAVPRDGRPKRIVILRELARREEDHEPPPTLEELGALTGLTVPGVQHHVNRMKRDEWIRRGHGARWLVMTDLGRAQLLD